MLGYDSWSSCVVCSSPSRSGWSRALRVQLKKEVGNHARLQRSYDSAIALGRHPDEEHLCPIKIS